MSSRRFTTPSNTSVACIEGYTYTTNVWALCLVQGPFSVAPVPNPTRPIRNQLIGVLGVQGAAPNGSKGELSAPKPKRAMVASALFNMMAHPRLNLNPREAAPAAVATATSPDRDDRDDSLTALTPVVRSPQRSATHRLMHLMRSGRLGG